MLSHEMTDASDKPTIVHVASYASSYSGNFVASLNALSALCDENGLRQIILFPERAAHREWCARLQESGQLVYFVPDGGSTLTWAIYLSRYASAGSSVIFHTHFTQYDVAAWLACLLARPARRAAVIWHLHSDASVPKTVVRKLRDGIKLRVMGRSARIISVSEHLREQIVDRGFPPRRIEVVQNGIDLRRARLSGRSADDVRSALGVTGNRQIILLFGWEPQIKGVDIALEAVRILAGEGCQAVLVLVGMDKLQRYVREMFGTQLPPWLRVASPVEHVADFYEVSAVFLCPSRIEGLPYAVCEAMANSIPVIASDIPSLEWARESGGCIFFPSGDSFALAKKIKDVLQWTPEVRERRTSANSALVYHTYNIQTWAEKIMKIYKQVIGQSR